MDKERTFKSGTILTDGKILLYLSIDLPRDWTTKNNYGSKNTDYTGCKTYPKSNGAYVKEVRVFLKSTGGKIPGLWLQEGYHLQHFHPINKALINEKILKSFLKPALAMHDY